MTDESKPRERIYKWVYDVEDLERYEIGGYHPTHIGDELHGGRYRIVHKLGYGSYATVWLVRDQLKNRYAALKIATADPPREEITLVSRVISWSVRATSAATRLLRVTDASKEGGGATTEEVNVSREEAGASKESTDEPMRGTEDQVLHHLYLLRGAWFCRTLKACAHHLGLLLEGTWFSGTLKTFGNQLDLPLEGTRFYRALKTLWNGHGHTGGNYVLEMLDKFDIRGPNGNHQCIVLELLGPSLTTVLDDLRGVLPLDVARKVSMQLAEGLSYLHASGIVHGDLHAGNILFCIPGLHEWTEEKVCEIFGEPLKVTINRLDGQELTPHAPEYVVRPSPSYDLLPLCLADPCIKIVDFGEAFIPAKYIPRSLGTPLGYSSPEVIFRDTVGPPSDIWSLACLLQFVLSDRFLFAYSGGEEDEFLVDMVRLFGRLPDRWWTQWEGREDYFTEDGANLPGDQRDWMAKVDLKTRLLEDTCGAITEFGLEELAEFERVIRGMVRFEPGERISAKEVAQLLQRLWGGRGVGVGGLGVV